MSSLCHYIFRSVGLRGQGHQACKRVRHWQGCHLPRLLLACLKSLQEWWPTSCLYFTSFSMLSKSLLHHRSCEFSRFLHCSKNAEVIYKYGLNTPSRGRLGLLLIFFQCSEHRTGWFYYSTLKAISSKFWSFPQVVEDWFTFFLFVLGVLAFLPHRP